MMVGPRPLQGAISMTLQRLLLVMIIVPCAAIAIVVMAAIILYATSVPV
jgi:hypothetical protein